MINSEAYIIGVEITPLKKILTGNGQEFCVYPCVGHYIAQQDDNDPYIYVGIDEKIDSAYGFQLTVYALSPK